MILFCSKTLSYNISFGVALLSGVVSHVRELSSQQQNVWSSAAWSSRHWVSGQLNISHTQPISFADAEVLIRFPSRSLVINCCMKKFM